MECGDALLDFFDLIAIQVQQYLIAFQFNATSIQEAAEVDEQFRFRLPGAGKSNVFAGESEGLPDRLLRLIEMAGVDVEHGCVHLEPDARNITGKVMCLEKQIGQQFLVLLFELYADW